MEANPAAWACHNVKGVNGGHGYCLCRPTKCRGSTAFATPVDALGSPQLPWQGVVSTRPHSPSHRQGREGPRATPQGGLVKSLLELQASLAVPLHWAVTLGFDEGSRPISAHTPLVEL